jgi:sn-1 stearoyl-lipid 9-desaturase
MQFIDYILQEPSYGWKNPSNEFIRPTRRMIFREFFHRLNILKSRKNWLPFACWSSVLFLLPFIFIFIFNHFSIALAFAGFLYGMIVMGTHGTIWYHRYSTHQAYQFKNKFWLFITRFLVPKMIPEEVYVVSHHVHHSKSDQPGDPYYAKGGWLYCFLADVNHQLINRNLSENDYGRVSQMLSHTGVGMNNYRQYQKWGTVSKPVNTILEMLLSIAFWYTIFYFIGGHALATALMSGACLWAVGVRTFNYDGHGRGKDKRRSGTDFNHADFSINQYWPGFVAGEWHNNHHLYPSSARAGFLKYQLDFAWIYIYLLHKIGGISSYRDSKKLFLQNYYYPYLNRKTVIEKTDHAGIAEDVK